MNLNRYLITGGSGFIGTNLLEQLISNGNPVVNLDINPPKKVSHAQFWKNVSVLDRTKLEEAIFDFNPQVIIHLAAVTDLNGKDAEYYKVNTTGTENLIAIIAGLENLQKVIFTSSMYVCRPGYIPQDYNDYKPHTAYGESKAEGEMLVKQIGETTYDWVIIRPTSIWGPWFEVPYIDFFRIVYERKYFMFTNTCTKTYGFIENTIYQIFRLIESDKSHGKTFYLGDYPAIPISEWAEEISVEMNKGKLRNLPYWIIKIAALCGDVMKLAGIKFPITSFRLRNMTTDNIIPLHDLYSLTGPHPVSRLAGVKKTISWLSEYQGYQPGKR